MTDGRQEREIIFDEAALGDLTAVAQQLFSSGAQPGEPGYQRVLVRPEIHWWRLMVAIAAPVCVAVALGFLLERVMSRPVAVSLTVLALLAYVMLRMKRIIITLVEIYQHFAPDAVRNKCRFEPSCSQYMIAAVNKYGVCRGICKGVNRLCRCNINNGGYDEP